VDRGEVVGVGVTLQARILAALFHRTMTPRALYVEMRPESAEAVDHAIRSLVKGSQVALRCGHYQRLDMPVAPPVSVPKRPQVHVRVLAGAPLTRREEEVAELTAKGETTKALAEQLGIEVKSVSQHLTRIYRKLGVEGKTQLQERLLAREGAA